jgi:hypothetical protein
MTSAPALPPSPDEASQAIDAFQHWLSLLAGGVGAVFGAGVFWGINKGTVINLRDQIETLTHKVDALEMKLDRNFDTFMKALLHTHGE